MRLRDPVLGIILILGIAFVGYGLAVGDEAIYSIDVADAGNESDLETEVPVREYEFLEHKMQDAFRESLQTEESVRVPGSPGTRTIYVHYRDSYYRMYTFHGDAAQGSMFFLMAGGFGLIALSSVGWYLVGRRSD